MLSEEAEASRLPQVWLPDIVARVAAFLPPNFVACSLRCVGKLSASLFRGQATVQLSQPVPQMAFREHWSRPDAWAGLTLAKRRQVLGLIAASGVVANLELAASAAGCTLNQGVLEAALSGGGRALPCCAWIVDSGRVPGGIQWMGVLLAAARSGSQAICEWCLASGATWYAHAASHAYRAGHLELGDWLLSWGPAAAQAEGAWEALIAAADRHDLATLQRVWQRPELAGKPLEPWKKQNLLAHAASSPTRDWRDKAEWLASAHGCTAHVTAYAVLCKADLPGEDAAERCAWLANLSPGRCAPDVDSLEFAMCGGNVAVVRWVLAQGVNEIFKGALQAVAAKGHHDVLAALHAAGLDIKPKACALAAAGKGAQATLAWLLETYGAAGVCGLTAELFREAASSGDAGLLAWLRAAAEEQGPPGGGGWLDEYAWHRAASAGCGLALEWLAEAQCPRPEDGGPYEMAARGGDLRTLALLLRLGLTMGPPDGAMFASAVRYGAPLAALEWLLEHGAPVDKAPAVKACTLRPWLDKDEVMAWLKEKL